MPLSGGGTFPISSSNSSSKFNDSNLFGDREIPGFSSAAFFLPLFLVVIFIGETFVIQLFNFVKKPASIKIDFIRFISILSQGSSLHLSGSSPNLCPYMGPLQVSQHINFICLFFTLKSGFLL